MNMKELLTNARDLIEKGWTQGTLVKRGCYCAMGAVLYADLCEDDKFWRTNEAISRLSTAAGLDVESGIVDWNDAPERTQAEVLEVFDRAIASCP